MENVLFGKQKYVWVSFIKTHWGRVTHICVNKITTIGSNNDLSSGRRQAFIYTNAGILLIGPLGTNFSEFFFGIETFAFYKMHLKMSSAKWPPFSLGLNVLSQYAVSCSAWLMCYKEENFKNAASSENIWMLNIDILNIYFSLLLGSRWKTNVSHVWHNKPLP